MVKVCAFDTEMTGLPPEELKSNNVKTSWNIMPDAWPFIIQLSYILYDTESNSVKIFNKYIDIPDRVIITKGSIAVHHITKEKIANVPSENRATIKDALNEFFQVIKQADIIVGHHVIYDRKIVIAELLRLSEKNDSPRIQYMMNDNNFDCTMTKTKQICNLKYRDKNGKYKIKRPKLLEAYKHFFGNTLNEKKLHNALVDAVICLRVFCKYKYSIDICGKNPIITQYIKQISHKSKNSKKSNKSNKKKKTRRRKKY
jgi:DNA polymerase III epsilon subunit-like protein